MRQLNKKAAMFGLDARIALAIFGALSVITGAALYSAIQNSKVVALITEMQEIGKAWEAYYIDTGTNLPQLNSTDNTSENFYYLKSIGLVEDPGVSGWKGPYLNMAPTGDHLQHSQYKAMIMILTDEVNWQHWINGKCTSGKKCFKWVYLAATSYDLNYIKMLDAFIDNSDGGDTGDFRWFLHVGKYHITLKYSPIKNPND